MRKWLRLGLLLGSCACAGRAVDWKALRPQGYVSRFRGSDRPCQQGPVGGLLRDRRAVDGRANGAGTIASLEQHRRRGQFHLPRLGCGPEGKNEGILLLHSIGDRRSRLEVGYGLEPILPDGLTGSILREMRTALRQGTTAMP